MPRKKKPFVDKKKADKYVLVHRNQEDPLNNVDDSEQNSEQNSGPRTLIPIKQGPTLAEIPEEVLPKSADLPKVDPSSYFFEVDSEIERALEGNSEDEWEELPDNFVQLASMELVPPKLKSKKKKKNTGQELENFTIDTFRELTEERKLFDERFEKILEEYEGSLDDIEESTPHALSTENPPFLDEILDEYIQQEEKKKEANGELLKSEIKRKEIARILELYEQEEEEEDKDNEFEYIEEKEEDKWDCESIISTYSNLDNHPKLIAEPDPQKMIKLSNKTGIPLGVLPSKAKSPEKSKEKEEEEEESVNKGEPRKKSETPEEKKLRKQAVKSERKENRERKKNLKLLYKAEELSLKQSIKLNTFSII